MMRIDLHTHTRASDGALHPAELLDRAAANGASHLAITDHDTLQGYADLDLVPDGLTLISGIEWSTTWRKRGIHVLGLNIDRGHPGLLRLVEQQSLARQDRAELIAQRLENQGLEIDLARVTAIADGGQIGRPHFARYLVETDQVRDPADAFKRYLGRGKAGDVKAGWAGLETIIETTRAAGGQAVLAHPDSYGFTATKLRELLADFRHLGGAGMEVISGRQTDQVTDYLARLSRRFGLLASVGSDFHTPSEYGADVGFDAELPYRCQPVWEGW